MGTATGSLRGLNSPIHDETFEVGDLKDLKESFFPVNEVVVLPEEHFPQ